MEFKQSAKIFVIILKKKLPKTIGRKLTKESAALFLGIKTMNLEFVFLGISPKIKIKKFKNCINHIIANNLPAVSIERASKAIRARSAVFIHIKDNKFHFFS